MPDISKDIILLLQYLLPGFLVSWVFYGLTSHIKPSQFERVVQALIYSMLVQLCIAVTSFCLSWLGNIFSIGVWTKNTDLFFSLLYAVLIGLSISLINNKNWLHSFLEKVNVSKRESHPSEWHNALYEYPRFITLHLKDERRLYGWPEKWPSDPEKGHFFLSNVAWLNEDGSETDLSSTKGVLVCATDVRWIEFLKQPNGENDEKLTES